MAKSAQETAPEGEGYVFTLIGYHYYNDTDHAPNDSGIQFVVNHLLKNLQSFEVMPRQGWRKVPVGKIGISHPTILQSTLTQKIYDKEGYLLEQNRNAGTGRPGSPTGQGSGDYAGEGFDSGASPPAFGQPGGSFGRPSPGVPGRSLPPGVLDPTKESTAKEIGQLDFVLQFVWQPTALEERPEKEPVVEEEGLEQTQ